MNPRTREFLAKSCTETNKIRDTFFSESYRTCFKLNNVEGRWDITHIRIPFDGEKERTLREKLTLKEDELSDFYCKLKDQIKLEKNLLSAMKKRDDNGRLAGMFISYKIQQAFQFEEEEDRKEYWFISRPVTPIFQSDFLSDSTHSNITMLELVTLGTWLIKTVEAINEADIHIGAWDMDMIYMDDNRHIVNGCLLYAEAERENEKVEKTLATLPTLPGNASDDIRQGKAQSLNSDLYSVGALLWNISNGSYWGDVVADLSATPKYASAELQEVLSLFSKNNHDMESLSAIDDALDSLANKIRQDRDRLNVNIPLVQIAQGPHDSRQLPSEKHESNFNGGMPIGMPETQQERTEASSGTGDDMVSEDGSSGTDTDSEEDPFLSGMELVEAELDLDSSEDDSNTEDEETMPFEMVDLPFQLEDEPAENIPSNRRGYAQRTPLRPRKTKEETEDEDDLAPKSKKKIIASVIIASLVLVLGFSIWESIYLKHNPGDATISSQVQTKQNANTDDTSNEDSLDDENETDDFDAIPDDAEPDEVDIPEESLKTEETEVKKAEETTTTTVVTTKPSSSSSTTSSTSTTTSKPTASKPAASSISSSSSSAGNTASNSSRPSSNTRPSTSSNTVASRPSSSASSRPSTGTTSRPSNSSGSPSSSRPAANNTNTSNGSTSSSTGSGGAGNTSSSGSSGSNSSNPNTSTAAKRPTQTAFSVSPGSVSISVGGSVSLSANAPCTLTSSNSGVAYISGRSVVGVAPGTCTITAISSVDGSQKYIVVSVTCN